MANRAGRPTERALVAAFVALALAAGVCDASASRAKQQFTSRHSDAAPLWSPDGRWISFVRTIVSPQTSSAGDRQIWLVRSDRSSKPFPVMRSWMGRGRDWSRDGRRLIFDDCCTRDPRELGILQMNVPQFGGDGTYLAGKDPHYGPDSTGDFQAGRVAWVSGRGDLRVQRLTDGYAYTTVAAGVTPYTGIAWSPDGSSLVFPRDGAIETARADGSGTSDLTYRRVAAARTPSWSPSGGAIAFVGGRRHPALYTVSPVGLELRRLLVSGSPLGRPVWSPDGRRIALARGHDVVVLSSSGAVVATVQRATAPSWGADPRRLTYAAKRGCTRPAIYSFDLGTRRETRLTTACRR